MQSLNSRGNWNYGLAPNYGAWNQNQAWLGYRQPDRNDYVRFGAFGWPWFAAGWGPGLGWPNYYDYGYPPYGNVYGDYSDQAVPYTSAYAPSADTAISPPSSAEAPGFYEQALAAFSQGDYGNATRLAGHAAIDDPRNPNVHALAMLGLFALGEYRGAAMEAHALAALGRLPDWRTVYEFYGDVKPYTEQLRRLEKFVIANPSAAEGRFLLGFQYLVGEYRDAARAEFLRAVKLTPRDALAAKLLTQAGGTVPADIVELLSQQGAKLPAPAPPATLLPPPPQPQATPEM